jgi:hypothetical protein
MQQLMERLKVDPHRMGGIREASMRKGICRQQVTEFIVNERLWQGQ